ncbi:NAD(P)-dependent oxidoreductase [Methyloradius palustris]|uniref:NAD(P)-dependent oxidoreductase n=2 Tax=Methyloradius palustris TaxID=2778876 RepID=A0A8D5G051_9PROT|nr:SDR family oxidoreductase [Methyloradius palustris]BCM25504.1 NAD(P)-dependent oxidoreductase [Methyloradius palustris]
MQANILIVGCGDLGREVARLLVNDGMHVTGVRRSNQTLQGCQIFQADVTKPETLNKLAETNPDILIYCVAADTYTDDSYRSHYVDGLSNTLQALKFSSTLRHVFFVSSTGVYGQEIEDVLDETVLAIPKGFNGERMLQAEASLNDPSLVPAQVNTTILRFSGIYGLGRTRMLKLAAEPENWPASNAWTNRIHRDDGAAFIRFLIHRALSAQAVDEIYLVTDSLPVAQYDVLLWIASKLGKDVSAIKVPAVLGNKRLSNQRMLSSGYKLIYPDYQAGYQSLLDASRL